MHSWGDEGVDWQGLNDAACFIAKRLRKYGGIAVTDCKEKYGTVRVYCYFGWVPAWATTPTLQYFVGLLNRIVIPIQQRIYVWVYKQAVRRWPHLYHEIVSEADYGELFEGKIPGYVHSRYWVTIS
jgi:hypothetical protein